MRLEPIENSGRVRIRTGIDGIGSLQLWVPEAIVSNTGMSAIYPQGIWMKREDALVQSVSGGDTTTPGNCPKIDGKTFECCGIRFPADSPVEWTTTVSASDSTVTFTIALRNAGNTTIRKPGAAVCLRFEDAAWWSDETAFVVSGGEIVPLSKLGRDAGRLNAFQAYLLHDQSYDHVFYRKFWGFNGHRLDRALMVSQNTRRRTCVGIQSDRAYFLHSNRSNPCTDIMLAFDELAPGATSSAKGTVWTRSGLAKDVIRKLA